MQLVMLSSQGGRFERDAPVRDAERRAEALRQAVRETERSCKLREADALPGADEQGAADLDVGRIGLAGGQVGEEGAQGGE